MISHGRRTLESDSHLAGNLCRLNIEVVENLDVIAKKADRHDDRDFTREVAKRLVDVGFEPSLTRAAAAALIGKLPRVDSEIGSNHPRRLSQLLDVSARLGHRDRNAVRGEDETRARA